MFGIIVLRFLFFRLFVFNYYKYYFMIGIGIYLVSDKVIKEWMDCVNVRWFIKCSIEKNRFSMKYVLYLKENFWYVIFLEVFFDGGCGR